MKRYQVGIGHLAVSRRAGDVLQTHALGSCIGLIVHEPISGAWGLAHIALPKPPRGGTPRMEPAYYATDAVPALLRAMMRTAGTTNTTGMRVFLAGGATVVAALDSYAIGKRNLLGVRKALWKHNLSPHAEDVLGDISRTVRVHVSTGLIELSNPSRGLWPLEASHGTHLDSRRLPVRS